MKFDWEKAIIETIEPVHGCWTSTNHTIGEIEDVIFELQLLTDICANVLDCSDPQKAYPVIKALGQIRSWICILNKARTIRNKRKFNKI